MVNYLALLGWGLGDEAIIPRERMVEHFRLEEVGASPASFDLEKLTWMKGEYIRALDDAELARRLEPWFARAGLVANPPAEEEREKIAAVAPLVKTRIERLEAAVPLVAGIFADVPLDPVAVEKGLREPYVPELLSRAIDALSAVEPWDRDHVEAALREVQTEMGLKPKRAFVPFYVAIHGSTVGAPIFDSMALLGREAVLERLQGALKESQGSP